LPGGARVHPVILFRAKTAYVCECAKCRPSSPSANANRIKNFLSTPLLLVARARDFVLRKGFGPRVDLILNCRRGSSGFGNNIVSESERILLKRCGEQCSNKRNPFLALCGAPSDSVYSSQSRPAARSPNSARCPRDAWTADAIMQIWQAEIIAVPLIKYHSLLLKYCRLMV
jgi:hypothetical protein